jgi:hypothetical protein
MCEALRLVIAATHVYNKERYALLVRASKIVIALREPRTHLKTFQKMEWALEAAIGRLGDCAGCIAMGATLADKRLFASVKRVVNRADPIALLRAGAPSDEYHHEINEVACRLPEECRTVAQTHVMVHRVFIKWFGVYIAGPRGAYRKLARALHTLRRQHSTRKEA